MGSGNAVAFFPQRAFRSRRTCHARVEAVLVPSRDAPAARPEEGGAGLRRRGGPKGSSAARGGVAGVSYRPEVQEMWRIILDLWEIMRVRRGGAGARTAGGNITLLCASASSINRSQHLVSPRDLLGLPLKPLMWGQELLPVVSVQSLTGNTPYLKYRWLLGRLAPELASES